MIQEVMEVNKIIYIAFMVVYNFFISTIAVDLGITTTLDTTDIITDIPTDVGILTSIGDSLESFINLLTFNITDGFPNVLVILFVYIPNVILLLVLIALIFNRN